MQCETPVLTSNVTSLPEVGGDAAIYVSPESTDEIAIGMTKISEDKELRAYLIEKGKERLQFYSWNKSAKLMWNSIQKTINS